MYYYCLGDGEKEDDVPKRAYLGDPRQYGEQHRMFVLQHGSSARFALSPVPHFPNPTINPISTQPPSVSQYYYEDPAEFDEPEMYHPMYPTDPYDTGFPIRNLLSVLPPRIYPASQPDPLFLKPCPCCQEINEVNLKHQTDLLDPQHLRQKPVPAIKQSSSHKSPSAKLPRPNASRHSQGSRKEKATPKVPVPPIRQKSQHKPSTIKASKHSLHSLRSQKAPNNKGKVPDQDKVPLPAIAQKTPRTPALPRTAKPDNFEHFGQGATKKDSVVIPPIGQKTPQKPTAFTVGGNDFQDSPIKGPQKPTVFTVGGDDFKDSAIKVPQKPAAFTVGGDDFKDIAIKGTPKKKEAKKFPFIKRKPPYKPTASTVGKKDLKDNGIKDTPKNKFASKESVVMPPISKKTPQKPTAFTVGGDDIKDSASKGPINDTPEDQEAKDKLVIPPINQKPPKKPTAFTVGGNDDFDDQPVGGFHNHLSLPAIVEQKSNLTTASTITKAAGSKQSVQRPTRDIFTGTGKRPHTGALRGRIISTDIIASSDRLPLKGRAASKGGVPSFYKDSELVSMDKIDDKSKGILNDGPAKNVPSRDKVTTKGAPKGKVGFKESKTDKMPKMPSRDSIASKGKEARDTAKSSLHSNPKHKVDKTGSRYVKVAQDIHSEDDESFHSNLAIVTAVPDHLASDISLYSRRGSISSKHSRQAPPQSPLKSLPENQPNRITSNHTYIAKPKVGHPRSTSVASNHTYVINPKVTPLPTLLNNPKYHAATPNHPLIARRKLLGEKALHLKPHSHVCTDPSRFGHECYICSTSGQGM